MLAATYIRGLDLLFQDRSKVQTYYITDSLGSTRGLTNSLGALTDAYLYDAFGNVLVHTGSTVNEFMFAGQQFDAALQQYYLRARYYSPQDGRFISRDSAPGQTSDPLTLQSYVYANDDPVNGYDPSGHEDLTSALVTIGTIALQGALVSGAAYGVSLYAYNQTFSWQTFSIAVGLGAILAPMAVFCPPFGILLGTLGTLTGAVATYNVFTDPNATWGQVAASLVLTVAAGWGTYKGWQWWGLVKTFTQGNGLWVNPFQIAIPSTPNLRFDFLRQEIVSSGRLISPPGLDSSMPAGFQASAGGKFLGVRTGRYYIWAIDKNGYLRIAPRALGNLSAPQSVDIR